MVLNGFDVSHTKDQILFKEGDQDLLDDKLLKTLKGLRQLAQTHRKNPDVRIQTSTDAQREKALNRLETEMKSDRMHEVIARFEVPSQKLIQKSNDSIKTAVVAKNKPDFTATIGKLTVKIFMVKDMSLNDPYVIIESTKSETMVIVIINLNHPYWAELTEDESIMNFIRHCAYDGVAEWKAFQVIKSIDPDTVKLIKDNLLRIPLTIS